MRKIKKFSKSAVLFLLVGIFLVSGICSRDLAAVLVKRTYWLVSGSISVSDFISEVNSNTSLYLSYHDMFLDVNSLVQRINNTQYIEKDNDVILKMDNDYLSYEYSYIDDNYIDTVSDNVRDLYHSSVENGAQFLYVMCPSKGYNNIFPAGTDNYSKSNQDRYAGALRQKNIPTLVLREKMTEQGIKDEDAFFVTDHHWTPLTGLWAVGETCKTLNSLYDFSYDDNYLDIDSYDVKTYENWFLGSEGKKVGRYFSKYGADNIDLLIPKFETLLTEEQPNKGTKREGNFLNSVIYLENIEEKDYYGINSYATYSGGDFRLQIITNQLNENGKTFLIVRDSYACVMTPFLSLVAKQLYIIDIRDYDYYVGDRVNVSEYINEINPDYVLVIYNGIYPETQSSDRYNFN